MYVNPDSIRKGQKLYVNNELAEVYAVMHTLGGPDIEFWMLDKGEYQTYKDSDVLTIKKVN